MPSKIGYIYLVLFLLASVHVQAQLSPGDLSRPHAHLEGLLNCTKCHDLGKGISEEKCLNCHKHLKARIDTKEGYHSSLEVRAASCVSCHNDHHGRDFDIIRFDEANFDHDLTGYVLEGSHQSEDCRACHQNDFISNREIREKAFTFLGLEEECISCHSDFHQGTLSGECAECHDIEAFVPASLFDHADTDFPLKGGHMEVECELCHPLTTKNGSEFQEFAGRAFTNCTSCHEDVHQNRFGQQCTECHSEESWFHFKGMNSFNHNQTDFPLVGQHQRTDCFACHKDGTDNIGPFQEFADWQSFTCAKCHEDVHEHKFGEDCASCHSTQDFQHLIAEHTFDHELTDYPLEGEHHEVDCKNCHSNSKIEPLAFDKCHQCHDDYHQSEFAIDGVSPDCAECHTVQTFSESTYGFERHQTSAFPLEGAHLATPCFSCHKEEDHWRFKDIGTHCSECHEDVHEGTIDAKYYPEQACENCHSAEQWTSISFDHSQTSFELEGKHLETACNDCHLVPGIENELQLFSGLPSTCIDCHEDIHRGQFEIAGTIDCSRCHASEGWQAIYFDHNKTAFKLEGEHIGLPCRACHKETEIEIVKYTIYKIEAFECVSCHL